MALCSSFLTCDSRVTWLRRRTPVVSGIAIFQDSFILCGSLVFVRTEEAPGPTYIKIRVVCPLMQREALARIKADFTLQRVKGNFFQGLIWLLIIWAGLQKEKHWCLFQRQKLLLHYIKYVLQLLRCIAVCRYAAIHCCMQIRCYSAYVHKTGRNTDEETIRRPSVKERQVHIWPPK